MATQQEFFALFGEISSKFSNLEFLAAEILNALIDKGNLLTGIVLTSDFTFGKVIRHVINLAKCRFKDEAMKCRVTDLFKRIDELRETRNAFVHGKWVVNEASLAQDKITCLDSRWKPLKGVVGWTRCAREEWTMQDLRDICQEVSMKVHELLAVLPDIQKSAMIGEPALP